MDSAGALNRFGGPARPREIIAAAKAAGCGVMGIRAVQAGALTRHDRPRRLAELPRRQGLRARRPVPRPLRDLGRGPGLRRPPLRARHRRRRHAGAGRQEPRRARQLPRRRSRRSAGAGPPGGHRRAGAARLRRRDMLLHLSTWAEIEAFLARSRTIVIPIGSNEQHGPTGLLGTDWLCPEIIAHEAQKRTAPTSWSRRPSTSAWPSTTWTSPAPSRCAPRPSWPPSATGCARSSHHGFDEALFPERPRRQRRHHRGGVLRALRRGQLRRAAGAASRCKLAQLVGPARRRRPGPPAVPLRPRQPRHAVGDRRHPVGLSGRHQGRQLRPADRPLRPDPRVVSTSAPATPTAAWAPTPASRRPRRAANW